VLRSGSGATTGAGTPGPVLRKTPMQTFLDTVPLAREKLIPA